MQSMIGIKYAVNDRDLVCSQWQGSSVQSMIGIKYAVNDRDLVCSQ